MASTKFDGKTDFGLWRIKMKAMLVQQGLDEALKEGVEAAAGDNKEQVKKMLTKAHSTIILCLGDKVLREVAREETAAAIWKKLESLYMTKSLANRLHMKRRLYSYKFKDDKSIADQLDEFNKMVDDLENIGVKIESEDKAIHLLNALPPSFDNMRDDMLYGREKTITLDEVQSAIKGKEVERQGDSSRGSEAAGFAVKRGFDRARNQFKKAQPEAKSQYQSRWKEDTTKETRICHFCKKAGHLKKDCFQLKKKQPLQEATRIKSNSRIHSSTALFPLRLAPITQETTVGFEEALIEMKGRLYGEPSQLQTIPIVGMGGIGKTTLARYTYQDPSTTNHFDVRVWATVSQNSSAKIILSNLLSSIDPSNKEEYQRMGKEVLVQHGHRYLKKRRYLIVMDDLWDTNVWDDVRLAFPDDCNGSRIIITTRDLNVASYVDSSNKPHKIQLMSMDQSWRLLKEVVFGHENCPPELVKIGEHIAEKCKGLPLAIVVIAGVLSKLEQKQESWERVARNVSDVVNTSSDEQFSDILSVSYMHLPPHLKKCFLYMSCFPEDHKIDVSRLIKWWVAEGFLISSESKDMEELGYEYLEDLARRSLVLIEKKRYDGRIKAVKIHDVLRDLCIQKSRDENFFCIINVKGTFQQGIVNSHRLSICANAGGHIPNMDFTPIHTILFFQGRWAFDYWKKFRLLKVLDAMTVALPVFAVEISELIHLRYLALAFDTEDKRLRLKVPEFLSKLQNLQTLVMKRFRNYSPSYSRFLAYLPVAIWRMPQLRHIILLNGVLPDSSTDVCKESLPLVNLHTLSCIQNFTCSERILEMLPNLQKLGIYYYPGWGPDDEIGWSKCCLNNLVHLPCLEKLSIRVMSFEKIDLAQQLAFPVTLKRLTLSGGVIPWEEMTIIGSLPNLEVLKLKRNTRQGTIWETTEGEFCELKVLLIDDTDLEQWITESSHFPKLERLTLYECDSLKEIPCDVGEIPTLQLIEVDVQNSSVVQSAKCIQEEQQSFGNDLVVSLLKSRSWKEYSYF